MSSWFDGGTPIPEGEQPAQGVPYQFARVINDGELIIANFPSGITRPEGQPHGRYIVSTTEGGFHPADAWAVIVQGDQFGTGEATVIDTEHVDVRVWDATHTPADLKFILLSLKMTFGEE